MRSQLLALAMGTGLLAWWSCSGGTDVAGSNQTDTISVGRYFVPPLDTVGQYYFAPTLDSVTAGTNDSVSITFAWAPGTVNHNVTWDTGPGTTLPANSPTQNSGAYLVTLGLGTYTYECTIHSASQGMTGTIVVSK
jgi:plastocyanin